MPSLVLDEPHGSVLHERRPRGRARADRLRAARSTCPGASRSRPTPRSDHTLAYQYAPQGVPRLALRRTPADELVIAPYATALAAQIAPHRAVANSARARSAAARAARYGFIEALDFTPARQAGDEASRRVEHLHGAPPGHEHRGAGQRAARRRAAPLGHGRRRISRRSPRCCTSARRARCSVLHAPPPEPAADARAARSAGPAARRRAGHGGARSRRICCPTAATASRCAPTAPAGAAGAASASRAGATTRCATPTAASSTCAGTGSRTPSRSPSTRRPTRPRTTSSSFHADRVLLRRRWPELEAHTHGVGQPGGRHRVPPGRAAQPSATARSSSS